MPDDRRRGPHWRADHPTAAEPAHTGKKADFMNDDDLEIFVASGLDIPTAIVASEKPAPVAVRAVARDAA